MQYGNIDSVAADAYNVILSWRRDMPANIGKRHVLQRALDTVTSHPDYTTLQGAYAMLCGKHHRQVITFLTSIGKLHLVLLFNVTTISITFDLRSVCSLKWSSSEGKHIVGPINTTPKVGSRHGDHVISAAAGFRKPSAKSAAVSRTSSANSSPKTILRQPSRASTENTLLYLESVCETLRNVLPRIVSDADDGNTGNSDNTKNNKNRDVSNTELRSTPAEHIEETTRTSQRSWADVVDGIDPDYIDAAAANDSG